MAMRTKLNVQSFPRPPRLEKISRQLKITWNGHDVAETDAAYWVLETHHPPSLCPGVGGTIPNAETNCAAYYLPPSSIKIPLTTTARRTWCEWKGPATYYTVAAPDGGQKVPNRIWSYEDPTPGFEPIKGYLSFYAGPWDCYVDGERVEPQPGDFYGGWVTSEIEGIVKGKNGNLDPRV